MSIFGNIMSAIFGRGGSQPAPTPASPEQTRSAQSAPSGTGAPSASRSVDVEAVLSDLAKQNKQKLNWRTSIVDLMKLLDLDSSLAARKQLAQELHYTGDIERLGRHEHLAAQAGDAEARREWRQGAGRPGHFGDLINGYLVHQVTTVNYHRVACVGWQPARGA